jgi:DNA polymerase I-like protein with 3'-5' exonuclease and polymerase domains
MWQVHDELLFEVEAPYLDAAAALVRSVMEDAATVWGLLVSLPVKVYVGPDWGHLNELVDGS